MERKLEVHIMVDTEYSGDAPGDYSLLSIGAVIVGQHTPPFAKTFYRELQPLPEAGADPEAMAVNKLNLEVLKVTGTPPAMALREFALWAFAAVNPALCYPVMVSDGMHDWMWLRWYFAHFRVDNPFVVRGYNDPGHGIDMKSMLYGMHPTLRIAETRRASVMKNFPQYDTGLQRTHNALDDVLEQAERFYRMRQR